MKMIKYLPTFFLFFCFFSFTSVNVSAQLKPKGFQIGANGIYFVYPKANQGGSALRGTIGLMLTDYWVVGVQPFFGRIWSGSQIITGKGTGFYSRLYALDGRFKFYGELSYSRGKLEYTSDNPVFNKEFQETFTGSKGEYALFGIGASFFLSKERKFAIELSLPIVYMRNRVYRDTQDYQQFTPMIGIQYFFRKE